MKNRILNLISLLLLLCVIIGSVVSCDIFNTDPPITEHVHVDYVSQLKLDMSSTTLKLEVTMKMHIDGDTTHFYVPTSISSDGVMKARYLAVNTPESTGRIEEWGKAASRFTQEKLENAHSIMVESNDSSWNRDGNGRFLVFVWYKPTADADYRNLNLELLQEGLAPSSSPMETIYGDIAVAAVNQATIEKLYVFSQQKDPEYPYGDAESITLKELRLNSEDYIGKKVAFEGVVTYYGDNTAFVEEFDPETGIYFGVQLFDGYNTALVDILEVGNRIRVCGYVTDYHGTLQVSDLKYNRYKPKDPANTWLISEGHEGAFPEKTVNEFNSNIEVQNGEETVTGKYHSICLSTTISMKNLKVIRTYTTASNGAITLTCRDENNNEISIRVDTMKDANGNLVTEQYFSGETIDVKGIIDYFNYNEIQSYQVKVFTFDSITIH